MGAWGHGPFENDDSCDWILALQESSGVALVRRTLRKVLGGDDRGPEAPECCEALAAAEVVATLHGHPIGGLPEGALEWVARQRKLPDDLVPLAQQAVASVKSKSELRTLWQETEHFDAWNRSLDDLEARLGIDRRVVEAPKTREKRTGKKVIAGTILAVGPLEPELTFAVAQACEDPFQGANFVRVFRETMSLESIAQTNWTEREHLFLAWLPTRAVITLGGCQIVCWQPLPASEMLQNGDIISDGELIDRVRKGWRSDADDEW